MLLKIAAITIGQHSAFSRKNQNHCTLTLHRWGVYTVCTFVGWSIGDGFRQSPSSLMAWQLAAGSIWPPPVHLCHQSFPASLSMSLLYLSVCLPLSVCPCHQSFPLPLSLCLCLLYLSLCLRLFVSVFLSQLITLTTSYFFWTVCLCLLITTVPIIPSSFCWNLSHCLSMTVNCSYFLFLLLVFFSLSVFLNWLLSLLPLSAGSTVSICLSICLSFCLSVCLCWLLSLLPLFN